jgi:peptide/nickel transport system substrate-binding protein
MTRRPALFAAALTFLLLAVACAPAAPPAARPGERKPAAAQPAATAAPAAAAPVARVGATGQFVIGSLEEPGSLSPLAALPHHFPEHVPQTLMFDSLIQVLPDGSAGPRLAEKWDTSPDGLTYTFTLTDKATWWDGKPVTSEDVKFTFETALKPESRSSMEGLESVVSVDAPDPRTVKVVLKAPVPMFLAQGGSRGIVPKHLLANEDLGKSEFNKKPVGSGPFTFVSWMPGQAVVMEANPAYFLGAPTMQRVVFKILPDQNVILTQLRSGELNYALITPKDLRPVESISSVTVHDVPTLRFFDISPNYQRPFFADQKVREAILYGIDRQGIVDKALLGKGAVIEANAAPTSWAYNAELPKHAHDPAKAKALLDSAGWLPGPDGVRAKDGARLTFGVMINSFDRTLEQALVVAQQNLKDVGVDMAIDRVEPGVFGSRRGKKEYDALARIWNPVYDPDQASLLRTGNFYGYSNPKVDTLAADALATGDQATRTPIYQQLQSVLAADVARIWLYTENELHAVSANVSGMQPHPVNYFWNLREWKVQ